MENIYPPNNHDFISGSKVYKERLLGQAMLESAYQENCRIFRAAVLGKLEASGALHEGRGWALFITDSTEGDDSIFETGPQEILVMSSLTASESEVDGKPVPAIRILTNEKIGDEPGEWYAMDIIVDSVNDAQYMVDATPFLTEREAYKSTYAVLFTASEGSLGFTPNFQVFPASLDLTDASVPSEKGVFPMGKYTCIEDRIHALNKAKAVFGAMLDLEPIEYYNPMSEA
jgi:hypothetical protein